MGKRNSNKKAKEIESQEADEALENQEAAPAGEDISEDQNAAAESHDETFAESKGLPENFHAKKLAQADSKAKAKAKGTQYPICYSKVGNKVVKLISKPGKTVSVYIGNLSPKKHKAALEGLIAKWQKDGVWVEEHNRKAYLAKKQAEFAALSAKKVK
jgi:hypothetical protein